MREKLIELISQIQYMGGLESRLAYHLIANGVTIQKWIPVTERLPDELPQKCCAWSEMVRPSVDVLVKRKGLKELYTAWYSYSHKEWTDVREEHSFTGVTHWMPLPEPPSGERRTDDERTG